MNSRTPERLRRIFISLFLGLAAVTLASCAPTHSEPSEAVPAPTSDAETSADLVLNVGPESENVPDYTLATYDNSCTLYMDVDAFARAQYLGLTNKVGVPTYTHPSHEDLENACPTGIEELITVTSLDSIRVDENGKPASLFILEVMITNKDGQTQVAYLYGKNGDDGKLVWFADASLTKYIDAAALNDSILHGASIAQALTDFDVTFSAPVSE